MQMKVILVRHGDAVGADIAGQDFDRWLSLRGRRDVTETAQKLVRSGFSQGPIISSPLVRAVQTAELLARERPDRSSAVGVLRALASEESSISDVRDALQAMQSSDPVFLVGHMPFLQELGANLCDDRDFPTLPTASACILDRRAHSYVLTETIKP